MKTILENQFLVVQSKTSGAELTNIRAKSDNCEYLWQADGRYWARHAPLLFPIVGAAAGGSLRYEGKRYPMNNHGFARDSEFEIAAISPLSVTYRLTDSKETLGIYPFKFVLDVKYTLDGRSLAVEYIVNNTGDKEMLFSIGAHPAFNCPLREDDKFTDYYLEFGSDETLDRQFIDGKTGLIIDKTESFLDDGKVKPLTDTMFDQGALLFEGYKSTSVALKGNNTTKSVTVEFAGFPQLGIWAPPGAPFVCIEPWYGIADSTGFDGELSDKKGILALEPGAVFNSRYGVVIGE